MKKLAIVTIALLVVTGCGKSATEKAAEASASASALAQAKADAALAKRKAADAAAQVLCTTQTKPLLDALNNLDGQLATGMQFTAYTSALGQASVAVNALARVNTQGNLGDSCRVKVVIPLANAYSNYAGAETTWNNCITTGNCDMSANGYTTKALQASWSRAGRAIGRAEAALPRVVSP